MDAIGRISPVLREAEVLSGDELVELDVASRKLVDQVGGGLGDHLVLVGVAVRAVPGAQELLIDVVGVLAGGKARLVGGGDPVARRIGRVDLVDQADHSVLVLAELVLRVHQDQAVLVRHLLSEREQLARLLRAVVPVLLAHEAALDHILGRDQLVVLVRLRRRRDQVLPELLVLLEALGQVDAAVLAHTVLVVRPQRRRRRARDVPAHHELDRERRALAADRHVRVGDRQHVVRHDVLRLLEPPRRGQVQHLALERHRAQLAVEARHAVRGDQHHLVVALEAVTHLTDVQVLHVDALQVRLRKRVACGLASFPRQPILQRAWSILLRYDFVRMSESATNRVCWFSFWILRIRRAIDSSLRARIFAAAIPAFSGSSTSIGHTPEGIRIEEYRSAPLKEEL